MHPTLLMILEKITQVRVSEDIDTLVIFADTNDEKQPSTRAYSDIGAVALMCNEGLKPLGLLCYLDEHVYNTHAFDGLSAEESKLLNDRVERFLRMYREKEWDDNFDFSETMILWD